MRIGVFDSGVGGLTVLREILRHLPGHSTIYLGDTARVPYGTKSAETVCRYARLNAEFLLAQGIDFLVVACNTASAFAMSELENLPVPVVGVVLPGARLAAEQAKGGKIGVLGTAGTVRSGAYESEILKIDPSATVESIACPMFVPLAEEGWVKNDIARSIAERYLRPWIKDGGAKPTCVVLGCTHYPLLRATIRDVLGDGVRLIDSASAVAAEVRSRISVEPTEAQPTHRICLTDASDGFVRLAGAFLHDLEFTPPQIELVDLEIATDATPIS